MGKIYNSMVGDRFTIILFSFTKRFFCVIIMFYIIYFILLFTWYSMFGFVYIMCFLRFIHVNFPP